MFKNLILIFICLMVLQSCNYAIQKVYGIKTLTEFNDIEYKKINNIFTSQYTNITESIISSDTSFLQYSTIDTSFRNITKQPIQILYFKSDSLKSYQANCFAPGNLVGHLNWNYENRFGHYFPISAVNVSDKHLNLSDILHIYNIEMLSDNMGLGSKEVIVFFWTTMLKKQSEQTFKTIVENIALHKQRNEYPSIICINTDNFFISHRAL